MTRPAPIAGAAGEDARGHSLPGWPLVPGFALLSLVAGLAAPAALGAASREWGPRTPAGRIAVGSLGTPYVKDPAFVDGGRPLAGRRYVIFGDLVGFYLKGFSLLPARRGDPPALRFEADEVRLRLRHASGLDGLWAPDLHVIGDRLVLLYSAGHQSPEIQWPSFRLRIASAPLARATHQLALHQPVDLDELGLLAPNLAPFGPGDADFGVIDPQFFVSPHQRAYMSYTVVRYGIAGRRYHEESVRVREVDPRDPRRAIGPDQVLYEGRAKSPDDGVAEAQDLATLGDQTVCFISSRAGDRDQRVLVARVASFTPLRLGPARVVLAPTGSGWRSRAVGSTSAAWLDGHAYLLFQGLDAYGQFSLGWTALDRGPLASTDPSPGHPGG